MIDDTSEGEKGRFSQPECAFGVLQVAAEYVGRRCPSLFSFND